MFVIPGSDTMRIPLGRLGENLARVVQFPIGYILDEFPDATFSILNKRKGDIAAYPVNSSNFHVDGRYLMWTITSGDLAKQGSGECQIVALKDGAVVKTVIYQTTVGPALDGSGTTPEPWESWTVQIIEAAESVNTAYAEWTSMSAEAETLASGTPAYARYEDGVLYIGIPRGEDGSDIIDDTAGAGDTDKTWSAAKIISELLSRENPVFTGSVSMGRKANTERGENSTVLGYEATASGLYSFAEGSTTNSTGFASHAEGAGTTSSGNGSHAEGLGTTASAFGAHAEGSGTQATNQNAHAEGTGSHATGSAAHAEGGGTTASGDLAHAEGGGTTASGENSHAEGSSTTASGTSSHAEGNGSSYKIDGVTQNTGAFGESDHVEGYQTHANSFYDGGTGFGAHAEGYRTKAIGTKGTHAEGDRTAASNEASHAEGSQTTASHFATHAEGDGTTARGQASHAEGTQTNANGHEAHAEGYQTTAANDDSHSEGKFTRAAGIASHAEGYGGTFADGEFQMVSQAYGTASHAEGYMAYAGGNGSHAEGKMTITSDEASHAEGVQTKARSVGAHAEGIQTDAGGAYSHAEGYMTGTAGLGSHSEGQGSHATSGSAHAEGNNTTASGTASHAEGMATAASGYVSHAEGFGGTVSTLIRGALVAFDSGATGYYSHTEGQSTRTEGDASHAEGYQTRATGGYGAHAEGYNTHASAPYAHAENRETLASGTSSHAEGHYTQASSSYAHSEGYFTNATGAGAHAEGNATSASGSYAHAEGSETIASGAIAHAEGEGTTANLRAAHAEGDSTVASGHASHAEGSGTTADGSASHAEGSGTRADGNRTHAEGTASVAGGNSSHAEGIGTETYGDASHAEGDSTYAFGDASHAQGKHTYALRADFNTPQMAFGAYNVKQQDRVILARPDTATEWEPNKVVKPYSLLKVTEGEYEEETVTYYVADHYVPAYPEPNVDGGVSPWWDEYTPDMYEEAFNIPQWDKDSLYSVDDKVYRLDADNRICYFICTNAVTETYVPVTTGYYYHTVQENAQCIAPPEHEFLEVAGNGYSESTRSNARALDMNGNEFLAGEVYVKCNNDSTGGVKLLSPSNLGVLNTASGQHSLAAAGMYCTASGMCATAFGMASTAAGQFSHARGGGGATATGMGATAVGSGVRANGAASFALGMGSTANGVCSVAVGSGAVANGANSAALGGGTQADGSETVAIGMNNYVEDYVATLPEWAPGEHYVYGDKVKRTLPNPDYDAEENNEVPENIVIGYMCMNETSSNTFDAYDWSTDFNHRYALIVGNGYFSGTETVHSNAAALEWTGDMKLAGDVYVGCNNDSTGGTKLVKGTDYASSSAAGVVKINAQFGLTMRSSPNQDTIMVSKATADTIKGGTQNYQPIVPTYQHYSVFYGLAKAAGDTTQGSTSATPSDEVGTYTPAAKTAIQTMLGVEAGVSFTENVSGSTPTITALPNVKYKCGEVSTLTITAPANGTTDIWFTSGSTATLLTTTGITFPDWFDPTELEINTVYEIIVTDGFGEVATWARPVTA